MTNTTYRIGSPAEASQLVDRLTRTGRTATQHQQPDGTYTVTIDS